MITRFTMAGALFFLAAALFFPFSRALALAPEEVAVIANMNAASSRGLAEYYMAQRSIPKENLILVFLTDKETCTRDAYEQKVVPRVRRAVVSNTDIRALVTIYGVPLRIASPGYTQTEKSRIDRLEAGKHRLSEALKEEKSPETSSDRQALEKNLSRINRQIRQFKRSTDKGASFDSELMLVKKNAYEVNMWLPNPYFLGWKNKKNPVKKSEVLMVSRLDGASGDIVRRVIDDSIEAEKTGVSGTAYFDARWKDPGDKKVSGYGLYDRSIHRAAEVISKTTSLPVVLDDTGRLFQKGEAPNALLYCGWYSLARYVDAFTWHKGAIGFHIASAECQTLKSKNSRVWCKKMLDNGVAATIGPVGEPYVQSFPMPELFFDFLARGQLTLAESYLVSLPYVSWKMVLVGDPLYRLNLRQQPQKAGVDP